MSDSSMYLDGIEGDFPIHKAVVEGKIMPSKCDLGADMDVWPQPCRREPRSSRPNPGASQPGARLQRSQSSSQMEAGRDIS